MPLLGASVQEREALLISLQAAIEILSNYARQLNEKDSGTRKTYETIQEFMKDVRSK